MPLYSLLYIFYIFALYESMHFLLIIVHFLSSKTKFLLIKKDILRNLYYVSIYKIYKNQFTERRIDICE